jgi:hypothetical protein
MKLAEGDFAVLGFVLLKPMTGYELKAMMDATVGAFNRASYGGIYPSLKKLARAKLVSVSQSVGREEGFPRLAAGAAGDHPRTRAAPDENVLPRARRTGGCPVVLESDPRRRACAG